MLEGGNSWSVLENYCGTESQVVFALVGDRQIKIGFGWKKTFLWKVKTHQSISTNLSVHFQTHLKGQVLVSSELT